ncbi:MAG: LysM peptidoglycan-binding domain-containing protein [Planctomycetota bacterium]
MHTDRKIGFAMGILLIGIVAALFFRNEPLLNSDLPTVRREHELNERLRERDVAVYLDETESESVSVQDQTRKPGSLRDALDSMSDRKNSRMPSTAQTLTVIEPVTALETVVPVSPDDEIVPIPTVQNQPKNGPPSDANPIESKANGEPVTPIAAIPSAEVSRETEPKADPFQPPADFEEYVVKYGDTLSGISQRFLGSQSRYREIYEANRDRMSSPDRLDVGKPLRIPRVASASDSSPH